MKVAIEDGVLTVDPETKEEKDELNKWYEDNYGSDWEKCKMTFYCE